MVTGTLAGLIKDDKGHPVVMAILFIPICLFIVWYLAFYNIEIKNDSIYVKKAYQKVPTVIKLNEVTYYGKPRVKNLLIDGPSVVEVSDGFNTVKVNLKIFSYTFANYFAKTLHEATEKKTLV